MTGTTYTGGSAAALVGPAGALLLLGDTPPERIARLWPAVRDGGDLHQLLEVLAAEGLRDMGPFALRHGSSVVLRGEGSALLVRSGTRLDGRGVTTWTEHAVDADEHVRLLSGDADRDDDHERLPLVAGVVRASSVDVGAVEPASVVDRAPAVDRAPVVGPAPVVAQPAPVVEAPAPAPADEPTPEPVVELPAPPPAPVEAVPVQTVQPDWTLAPEPAEAPAVAPVTPVLVDDVPSAEDGYDHLFGDTVHRSVEDAAVRPVEPVEPAAPATAVLAGPDGPDTDHDGSTVLRSALQRARPAAPPRPVPTTTDDGPRVLGLRCAQGHANPPHGGTCRWCGAAVSDAEPQLLARPALGRLRVSDGATVALDRSVLIGRAPASTRFSADGPPHLLRVASPQQDISRTHVEVRVEDWDVLVVDHSANGTRLVRPGAEPQMLHRDEPVLVLPGSTLDLGDGVTVVYEADGS